MEDKRYFFATGMGVVYALKDFKTTVEDVFFLETLVGTVTEAYKGDLIDEESDKLIVGLVTQDELIARLPHFVWSTNWQENATLLVKDSFELHLNIRINSGFMLMEFDEEKVAKVLREVYRLNLFAISKPVIKSERETWYLECWNNHSGKEVVLENVKPGEVLCGVSYWDFVEARLVAMAVPGFLKELDHILLVNGASMLTAFVVEALVSDRTLVFRWEDIGYGSGVAHIPMEQIDDATGDLPLGIVAWAKDVARAIGETNLSFAEKFRINISTIQRDLVVAHSYEYIGTGGTYVYPSLPETL